MSKRADTRKRKVPEAVGKNADDSACYVYCVGATDALASLVAEDVPASIDAEAPLELISVGDISVVTSAVPLAEYSEEALELQLNDPAWTATRALRHEIAVEHFARRATVIPLRFGTIYLHRQSIEKMLTEKSPQFRELFSRLEGREEWGVNIYVDRAKMMDAITQVSPRLLEMEERAAKSTQGQAYLLRKKIETLRTDEARVETKRVAGEIESVLTAVSEGALRLRKRKDEGSELGDLVLKLAFLVRREGFNEFREKAEALAQKLAQQGIQIELMGPWPAYNFVAIDREGITAD